MNKYIVTIASGILATLTACNPTVETPTPQPVIKDSFYTTGPEDVILKDNISNTTSSAIMVKMSPVVEYVELTLDPLPDYVTGKLSQAKGDSTFNTSIEVSSQMATPGMYTQHYTAKDEDGNTQEYTYTIKINPTSNTVCGAYFYNHFPYPGGYITGDEVLYYDDTSQQVYIGSIDMTNGLGGLYYPADLETKPEIFLQVNCNERTITIPETIVTMIDIGNSKELEYKIYGSGSIDPITETFSVDYYLAQGSNGPVKKTMTGKLEL